MFKLYHTFDVVSLSGGGGERGVAELKIYLFWLLCLCINFVAGHGVCELRKLLSFPHCAALSSTIYVLVFDKMPLSQI